MPGAWPRLSTISVRVKVITTFPSWLKPVVRAVTMPTLVRDLDSRLSRTSD